MNCRDGTGDGTGAVTLQSIALPNASAPLCRAAPSRSGLRGVERWRQLRQYPCAVVVDSYSERP